MASNIPMPGASRQAVRDAVRSKTSHELGRAYDNFGIPYGSKINDLTAESLQLVATFLGFDVAAVIASASAKADFAESVPAEAMPPTVTLPTPAVRHGTATAPAAPVGDATQAALAALLATLAPKTTVDMDTVRALVESEVAKAGVPRPLAIIINDQPRGTMPATRHNMAETLLQIVAQNIPAYLVGPAGSGKTTAAEQAAAALGLDFYMTGAVSGAHEYLGFMDAQGVYHATPFRQAFEHGGVFLADEIDGSDPAAPLVLNAALANGVMPFPDQTAPVARHADFRMIAAANTFGSGADRLYVGRNQMDASTLDRFAFISWAYDEPLERQLCGNEVWARRVQAVRAMVAKLSLRHVVSPRASIYGAKLLAAGMAQKTVETLLLWKGLKTEDVSRLEGAC